MTGPQLTTPSKENYLNKGERYRQTRYFKTETEKRMQTITDINEHGVTVTNEGTNKQ